MGNDIHRVKDNFCRAVMAVDDIAVLDFNFDTGAMIGAIPNENSFRKLTEEELAEK